MDDLDAQFEAVLRHHEAEQAKRKAAEDASDPHVLHKTVSAVFARVERRHEVDSGSVEIKAYEC